MIRKSYNPEASVTNILQIPLSQAGCCTGDTFTECSYDVTLSADNMLKSITFVSALPGVGSVTIAIPTYSAIGDMKKAIIDAFKNNGYVVDSTSWSVRYNATTKKLSIFGEVPVTSIVDNVTPKSFVANCVRNTYCEYTGSMLKTGLTSVIFTKDGVAAAAIVVAYPGDPLVNGDVTGKVVNSSEVVITDDGTNIKVKFKAPKAQYLINGYEMTRDNCDTVYTV